MQLILPPLYLAIRDDLGIDGLGPVMLFSTIYFLVYAATSLPYGILADRFSKKKILVFGAALNSLAFILAANTSSYMIFVVAMILAGLGGGTYHPVASALISNIFGSALGRAFITALMPVILVFGMRDFCLWGTTYLTPAMSQMNLGFSKKVAGSLIGVMSLTGVVFQPLAGTLSDRFGRRRVISIALLTGGLIVFFFPYFNGTMIFVAALIGGFMLLGTVPAIDAAAAEIVPPSVRGSLFGVMMTLGLMFGAVSPYSMGLIHDIVGGYRTAYLVLGFSGLAGGAMVFKIPSRRSHF